jgi:hypothetical protein
MLINFAATYVSGMVIMENTTKLIFFSLFRVKKYIAAANIIIMKRYFAPKMINVFIK